MPARSPQPSAPPDAGSPMTQARSHLALGPPIWIGEWRVDPALDEMSCGEQRVKLEPRKMRLLMALAAQPGRLVLADELLDTVWKDVVVTPNSLYQSVAQLRRQLGDDPGRPRYIVTVPRKGYRLVAPVRAAETSAGTTPAATAVAPASAGGPGPAPPGKPEAPEPPASPTLPPAAREPLAALPRRRRLRRGLLAGTALGGLGALAGLGAGLWRLWPRREAASAPPLGLAVLTLRDDSQPPDTSGLADAFTEQVIGVLSAEARLRVTARESAHVFRAAALEPQDVARQLGVAFVLEGRLQRSAERVRLELVLHDAAARRVRWHDSVERPAAELPRLPQWVAAQTLAALGLAAALPTAAAGVPSLPAFEAYVRGTQALRMRTPEALRSARGHFERAVALEPQYLPAQVSLAVAWLAETDYGSSTPFDEAIEQARHVLQRALERAPAAAEALAAQGLLHLKLRDNDGARPPLRRAVAARPSLAAAHFWLGLSYANAGRPRDALPHYAVAAELNPLDFQVHARLGNESMHAGLHDAARRHFERARELGPHHPNPLWGRALVGYASGRLDDAALAYRAALALDTRRADLWYELAWIHLDLGLPRLAQRAQAAFETHGAVAGDAAALRAAVAAQLGQPAPPPPVGEAEGQLGEQIQAGLAAVRIGAQGAARAALERIGTLWPQQHRALQGPYALFHDRLPALDVAAVAHALRDRDTEQWLSLARSELDGPEQGGCSWHSLEHQRARWLALNDAPQAALARLRTAVAAGWRRAWQLAYDPAFGGIPGADLHAALTPLHATLAAQRARVEREGG